MPTETDRYVHHAGLPAAAADTRYSGIYQDENGVNSYYNALAVQAQAFRTASRRLSYTWSHEIDDGVGTGNDALFYSSANNWSLPTAITRLTRATALDQRHRFVFTWVGQPTFTHRTAGSRSTW